MDYSDGTRVSPYGSFQDYTKINSYYRKTDENGNIKLVLDDHSIGDNYDYVAYYGTPT